MLMKTILPEKIIRFKYKFMQYYKTEYNTF